MRVPSALWGLFGGLTIAACSSDEVSPAATQQPVEDAASESDSDVVTLPKKVTKLDLVLMIDNSMSMADKQEILAKAVPDLTQRLVNPACVDTDTGLPAAPQMQPEKSLDPCPTGTRREFGPVFDIHIGVISSSIGGHGADTCAPGTPGSYTPRMQDNAHLISRTPSDPDKSVSTYQSKGFLVWDPTGTHKPQGETSIPAIVDNFAKIVEGVGQDGCGLEASLEAWYRFLVDPAPYQTMKPISCDPVHAPNDTGCRGPQGVDSALLVQRADFLREDSLVAILMLTDEDDCSIRDDEPQYYIVAQGYSGANPFYMPRGTSACATDPSSPACQSCAQAGAQSDPTCALPAYSELEDPLNLRCFDQKRRFGIDFLYPPSRYVEGLTLPTLSDGRVNPLFCSAPSKDGKSCTKALRDPSQVLLAGIVGVPWPDIALDPKDLTRGYLPGPSIPWDVILGDMEHGVLPKDPLMIPSIKPRSGVSPVTNEALAPTTASKPTANSVNGHEYTIPLRNDLQYACVFELATPRVCAPGDDSCDCQIPGDNPLCQDDKGAYGTTQYRAKAYPAPRVLSVIKGMESRGMLASICASNTTDPKAQDYGYSPAILSFIEAISASF
ncbi:MAG: hypothetical protein HY898_11145 [Deltaproteobacteria bacterium]|nr:hypothetical protein [Deltaproteobacteria bacterium]